MYQLEFSSLIDANRIVNVASVPQRSPFRYPGGKTWLIPQIRRWLSSFMIKPNVLIEPFAGGGIVGLTAAFENLAEKVLLVELDEQIAGVWETLIGGEAEWLANRILSFQMSPEALAKELNTKTHIPRERAFQTILRNRTSHGGIMAPGAGLIKTGENGRGIASRWYPQTLARRILEIGRVKNRLEFIHGDGIEVIQNYGERSDAAFFIDPPYTAGGKRAGTRLYTHYKLDHEQLFTLVGKLCGDFLMTYDNAEDVRLLAAHHGFDTMPISMKNTHHAAMTELLIGKNLDWARIRSTFSDL